ncbi:extracellular solute-binding protein [Oricola sp.]|uniref:ABC transporter substrate-binding protein n=1 Tax=Oricola sp. TaxID=1979950 RepID=UPI0025F43CFF|nr:extracellular solute-binding protein [Oricola sp.]MCI5074868.1 ABC transporter substrate-binding protein [Oricola sp.]
MKFATKTFAAAAAICAGLASMPASAQSYEPWEQELYDAAKEEGGVVWYVSQTTSEMANAICAEFAKRYPDVTCDAIRATGSVTFQRVMQEVQANAVQGDVYSSNDDTDFVEMLKADALAAYKPHNLEHMLPSMKAAGNQDGYWYASNISPYGIVYNTDLVPADEAPKTWNDLLDPKWKDQLAIAHPGFSGSMSMFTVAVEEAYGWEYFEKLEANKPQIGRSVSDGYNLVVSGERKVAIAPITLGLGGKMGGKPVDIVVPEDGLMLPPSGTGLLAAAPHPNAGKLFEEFLLGKEAAQMLADAHRFPLRSDVPTADGVPSLANTPMITANPGTAAEKVGPTTEKFRETFGI